MEEKCTFSKKVGSVRGLDKRYKETNVVPLLACKRNVTEHTRGVGIMQDIDTESELILARASIFVTLVIFLHGRYVQPIAHAWVLARGEGPTDVASWL